MGFADQGSQACASRKPAESAGNWLAALAQWQACCFKGTTDPVCSQS